MKLKNRILLALGLLTILIGVTALASAYFLKRLGIASENIMKDNFVSIEAAGAMTDALDEMDNAVSHSYAVQDAERTAYEAQFRRNDSLFSYNLAVAEANVTEPGEGDIIHLLHNRYIEYKRFVTAPASTYREHLEQTSVLYDSVKSSCLALLAINKKGMYIRNDRAKRVSSQAVLYTILLSAISLILAIVTLLRFPSLVLHPITELTEKIRRIAARKYSERIEVRSHDELGELSESFNDMAVKLDEYERSNIDALIAEKKQSEAIVQNMNDAVVVLSADMQVVLVNAIAAELLGVEEKDLVGQDVRSIAATNNLIAALISDVNAKSKPSGDPYLRIYHNGKEEFYLKDIIPIEKEVGDTSGAIGYVIELKNVSEFKALDEAKSGFVTTVSHELRTPLSALNMSIRLMQDDRVGPLNAEQSRLLDAMKQEVRRLLRIVNELLELSRAELGAELMHIETVTAESIVDAAVTPMMLQAEQKNVQLDVLLPPTLPLVRADSSKIAWVLINLLSNAIRFTAAGGKIVLSVSETGHNLEFAVSDTGSGIEPQYLDRVFDKFFQIRSTDQHSGVGLGLAISKEIIEAHGGTIIVESEVGKGSTFRFGIPVAA